jgi:hypothetical protein
MAEKPSRQMSSLELPDIVDKSIIRDRGGQTFNVLSYGLIPDGKTDNSPLFAQLLDTVFRAGGGEIFFPPSLTAYVFSAQIVIPNTKPFRGTPTSRGIQPPITLRGHRWDSLENTGAKLALRYQGSGAKIVSYGTGLLHLLDLGLAQDQNDTKEETPFILVTNTTLICDRVSFRGNSRATSAQPSYQTNQWPTQDAIILGGPCTSVLYDNSPTSTFGGYGSIIRNCRFNSIRRMVYLNPCANAVTIHDNFLAIGGSNLLNGAAIEFADSTGTPGTNGVCIQNNMLEMVNYQYGVLIGPGNQGNSVINLAIEDNIARTQLTFPIPPPGWINQVSSPKAGEDTLTSKWCYPPGTVLLIDDPHPEIITVSSVTWDSPTSATGFLTKDSALGDSFVTITPEQSFFFSLDPIFISDGNKSEWNLTLSSSSLLFKLP